MCHTRSKKSRGTLRLHVHVNVVIVDVDVIVNFVAVIVVDVVVEVFVEVYATTDATIYTSIQHHLLRHPSICLLLKMSMLLLQVCMYKPVYNNKGKV